MQTFELFKGLPADLVIRLNALKAASKTIVSVIVTHVSAEYIIIYTG